MNCSADGVAMKAKIAEQVYKMFEKYGAMSDILGTIGSYGDTLDDESVLRTLIVLNEYYETNPLPRVKG